MEVFVAKSAGFCFGVKRAVDTVYGVLSTDNKPIYTYGPIIHNESVVNDLEKNGVNVINSVEELKKITKGTVVIRSHGVSKDIYNILEKNQVCVIDATCPYVKKIHEIVKEENEKGRIVVIIGNDKHPEVEGIKGWANDNVFVINDEKQIDELSIKKDSKVTVVSQTTFNMNKFKYLVEILSKKGYDINVVNTICNATHVRQTEAREISSKVDAMIVIGGKNSSNTQKLFDICKANCANTYYIQTVDDLKIDEIRKFESVGITAGASTPKNIIEEVHTVCQN